MKLNFFITSIDHLDDSPYLYITVRSKMNPSKKPITLHNPKLQNIFHAMNKKFIESFETHLLISIEQSKSENFMVGDRIQVDITVNNIGEISQ